MLNQKKLHPINEQSHFKTFYHDTIGFKSCKSSRNIDDSIDNLFEPDEESTFGRQSFWNDLYRKQTQSSISKREAESQPNAFSWYSTWTAIQPFWDFLFTQSKIGVDDDGNHEKSAPILLPGVGNDPTIVEMYDDGWANITAFDYAPEGVIACVALLKEGKDRLNLTDNSKFIQVDVADARKLPYASDTFVGVLDKGTLDAVYLSGGKDPVEKRKQLRLAVEEISRIVQKEGVVLSITGAGMATQEIHLAFQEASHDGQPLWEEVWNTLDGVVFTDDGFASIDVDATMLAFKKI